MSNLDLSTPIEPAPFNKIWISNLVVNGSPEGKVSALATLKPFNGTTTLDQKKILHIPDVFAAASLDSTFAQAVNALMEEIGRQAKLKNLF